jgi:hypothetical protein
MGKILWLQLQEIWRCYCCNSLNIIGSGATAAIWSYYYSPLYTWQPACLFNIEITGCRVRAEQQQYLICSNDSSTHYYLISYANFTPSFLSPSSLIHSSPLNKNLFSFKTFFLFFNVRDLAYTRKAHPKSISWWTFLPFFRPSTTTTKILSISQFRVRRWWDENALRNFHV